MTPDDPVVKAEALGGLIDVASEQSELLAKLIRGSKRMRTLLIVLAVLVLAGLIAGYMGLRAYARDNRNATVALGDVICEAQALTTNSPAVRRARADLARIPVVAMTATQARILIDLQVLVTGAQQKAPDPARLLAAESRYVALVRKLNAPSSCIGPKR